MPGNAFQHLRDPAYMFNWLDYQTHGASAGQLEALGFFARQTVGQHLAMVGRQLPTLRAQGGQLPSDHGEMLTYGLTREEAQRFELPCGGAMRLIVEPVAVSYTHLRAHET